MFEHLKRCGKSAIAFSIALLTLLTAKPADAQFGSRFDAISQTVPAEFFGIVDSVPQAVQWLGHFGEGLAAYEIGEMLFNDGVMFSFAYQVGSSLEGLSWNDGITFRAIRGELYDIHQGMCPAIIRRAGRTSAELAIAVAGLACALPMFLYVTDEVPQLANGPNPVLRRAKPITLYTLRF